MQSFVLAAARGLRAILIVAALMAFLPRPARRARRHVAQGAWAAVGASLVTAAVVELLFEITPGQREALEGVTMPVATAVLVLRELLGCSRRFEVAKWSAFVKGRMEEALSTGSGFALASVAFLAVYREGFETILFYKALLTRRDRRRWLSRRAGAGGHRPRGRRARIVLCLDQPLRMKVPLKRFSRSRARCSTTWLSCRTGKGSPICRSPGSWDEGGRMGATHPGARHLPHRGSLYRFQFLPDRPAGRGVVWLQRNRFNGPSQIVGGRRSHERRRTGAVSGSRSHAITHNRRPSRARWSAAPG